MFLLDYLYKECDEYPKDGNYIEKFLFYRERKKDCIDVDVCDISIINYILTNPSISNDAKIRRQKYSSKKYEIILTNPSISNDAKIRRQKYSSKKYETTDREEVYRGETIINCLQILLQVVNYGNNGNRIKSTDFAGIKRGSEHSSLLNSNPRLREILMEFVKECYSEGNFYPIPFKERKYSLNLAKGRLPQKGYCGITDSDEDTYICDSNDEYFKILYNYFQKGDDGPELASLIDTKYSVWKERYRNKWELFVEDNALQDFVHENNEPKTIWDFSHKDFEHCLEDATSILSRRRERIISARNESTIWKEAQSSNDDFSVTIKRLMDEYNERRCMT